MARKVEEFAVSEVVADTEPDMIPYPASWANAGRYDDPPEEWKRKSRKPPPGKAGLGLQFMDEVHA
jgi:hypothetical protein